MSRQKADTGTLYLKPVESAQHNMSGSFRCSVPYSKLRVLEYVSQNSQCELSLIGTSLYFASNFIFLYSSTTTTVLSSSTHIA